MSLFLTGLALAMLLAQLQFLRGVRARGMTIPPVSWAILASLAVVLFCKTQFVPSEVGRRVSGAMTFVAFLLIVIEARVFGRVWRAS
jgi:hypothetical protein